MSRLSPEERLARYGPTTGDRVRLGDTDLWVRVDEDRQAPGDEPIWGYAKTIRPARDAGPARPVGARRRRRRARSSSIPLVGVVKADIGIKDGRIVGVGRAGNPAISDGIELPIGPHTQPIMGYGLIATPGAVDSHVHAISPQLAARRAVRRRDDAHHRRLRGAAVGDGADARRASPAGRSTSGSRRAPASRTTASLEALLDAGACGFKIHEDYGRIPGADRPRRCGSPTPTTSRSRSTPTGSTSRRSSRTRSRRSPAGPSTPITSRGPAAATCRTCWAWSARPTSSARRRRRRCRSGSTRRPSRSR